MKQDYGITYLFEALGLGIIVIIIAGIINVQGLIANWRLLGCGS